MRSFIIRSLRELRGNIGVLNSTKLHSGVRFQEKYVMGI